MKVTPTEIPDVLLIEPKVFKDERGFFFESYNQKVFWEKTGLVAEFVQDNHSLSTQNTVRGLHYQINQPQAKLIRVTQGIIFDVAVDLRQSSPTFGQWIGCILSGENKCQLWVPIGFAHGFSVLSETAEVLYKTTDFYAPTHERCLLWNEPELKIDWQLQGEPIISPKDRQGKLLKETDLFP